MGTGHGEQWDEESERLTVLYHTWLVLTYPLLHLSLTQTIDRVDELHGKHTLFGRVMGEVYSMWPDLIRCLLKQ